MSESLYIRLGGTVGITQIASDLVEFHLRNPLLAPRFVESDPARLKEGAASFFIAGTGGPQSYRGKSMAETHKGMNISAGEFLASLEDTIKALTKNHIGKREQEEVLFTLFSMKPDILMT